MNNPFYNFLKSLEDVSFDTPDESGVKEIMTLSSGKLPKIFIECISKYVLADEVEYEDFVFYGIDRMVEENTDCVPGANLLPLGLFTFASTFDGDGICFDCNDSRFPVYQCSHSLVDGEDDISYYKNGKMYELPFNYENVIAVSPKLAISFDEFVSKLQSGEVETFSVSEMIERI